MAYRFTSTDKWGDGWFSNLRPAEKLLFIYLCDNCDIAGFAEINIKRWCSDTGYDKPNIEGALKGLQRGLVFSIDGDCVFLKNFLKHQKNLPLRPDTNPSHRGIVKRFDLYRNKFNITNIEQFIEGASKGLQSPIGNGNGKEDVLSYEELLIKVVTENKIELTDEFKSLFLEWLKYKAEKKQNYKEIGMKNLLIQTLRDCNNNPAELREMILYSTSKNYDGLFKEKQHGNNRPAYSGQSKDVNSQWQ